MSALQSIQADSLGETEPECRATRPVIHQSPDELPERVQVHALPEGEPLARLGSDGGDGRHDRLPLFAQSKGDFRPKINFEQKLIYIYHR